MMRGQEWKDVRSSITPAFTTGKIKRVGRSHLKKLFNRVFHEMLPYLDVSHYQRLR